MKPTISKKANVLRRTKSPVREIMAKSSYITIGNRKIGGDFPPFIVAEMACAHEGKPELAHQLVDIAADAGADAIQMQIVSTKKVVAPYHPIYKVGLKLEISFNEWADIITHAQERELHVWANIFDESAMKIALDSGVDALKIHSTDLSNPDMLDAIATVDKPISLSVGGSTLDEMAQAVFRLRDHGVRDLILMHGFQAYPTSIEDSRPNFVRTLINLFDCLVGYQDHTDSSSELALFLPILAMGAGACLLEKHITDNRALKRTDYVASFDHEEFKHFVDLVHILSSALDRGEARPMTEAELTYRRNFKKTIVAARPIKKGEILRKDMLTFMRADVGLSPAEIQKIIGCKCRRHLKQYTTIKAEYIEPI